MWYVKQFHQALNYKKERNYERWQIWNYERLQDLPAMGSHDIKITDYTGKRKNIWTKY